jgi:hypothetical protein
MTRRAWTDDETRTLVEQYADTPTHVIAEQIGRALDQCYRKAYSLGLKKSADFLSSEHAGRLTGSNRGTGTRFQPGLTHWNKGTNFVAGGRSAETRFAKGVRQGVAVALYQPIGAERISKDGYLQRKVNDDLPTHRRWRAVHVLVWEESHGPLPAGHAVVFRDGKKTNIALDNLELVSRAELLSRNTLHRYPKDVALLIQLRGALVRKINNRMRSKSE